jgi:xylan 1,4-beta-xylosidase
MDTKKKHDGLRNVPVFVSLLVLVGLFASCDSSKKPSNLEESTAYFNSFTYKGMDDFYEQNKLPGEDYFFNPIIPGWYSDPSVCKNGEDYFLVTSTFSYFPGVPIFHSTDLVNWKQIGHVLDRESQLVNMKGQHTSGGIFAPAISYNPQNDTYYMITTNVGMGNFFVKTKDPFGGWSDPIMLPDVGGIDPSFFFDDDGNAYIVNNDEPIGEPEYSGHRTIRIHQFDVENDRTFGDDKVLVDKGVRPEENPIWIEGPHLYKIDGKYFLMSAEGGTGPNHSEVIMRGDSPMGPFNAWEKNPILTQRHLNPNRDNPITCTGHADLIQAKNGEWWSVFLACRPIDGKFENLGRETFLMPVKWSEDGFPYMTQGNDVIPMIVQKPGLRRADEVTFGNFTKIYPFNSDKLGYDWMSLRTSASDFYSLTKNPGYLSLSCAEVSATEKGTPAYVCRRLQHHKFECTTELYFNSEDEKDAAGLLLYKDETHQYFFGIKKVEKGIEIFIEKIGDHESKIIVSEMIDEKDKQMQLKIESHGDYYNFYYSRGNDSWVNLCNEVEAYYLSTANSYGFTGTTIGMYAVRNK